MPRIPGTNDTQSSFLRAFKTSPTGPAPDQWPSPAILGRWLRRPTFARALQSLLAALRFQSDFQLASAATHAANRIASSSAQHPDATIQDLERLLRLAHLRQRVPAAPDVAPSPTRANKDDSDPDNPPEPDGPYYDILNTPDRLKAYMQLCHLQGDDKYDDILKAINDLPEPEPQPQPAHQTS